MSQQKTTWAFAVADSGRALEIDIYDSIGPGMFGAGISAKDVRVKLQANKSATTIRLRVNSRGGDVTDGFAIYNLLSEHPARIEADIDSLAASMASVIVMAADEIRIASNAMMMVHNPWGVALGGSDDMRNHADLLDKMREQIAHAYVARTGLSKERVLAMMDKETWLTAAEAVEQGFADKVIKAGKTASAMASLDLSRFSSVPSPFASAVASARGDLYKRNGQVLLWNGIPWSELKPQQRADLKQENPGLFAAMRAAGTPKRFAELRPSEVAQLKRDDPALYAAMRAGGADAASLVYWVATA